MTIYATFSPDGFPTGFFTEAVHGSGVPAGAIGISEAQWREFLDEPGLRRWNGSGIETYVPPAPVPMLDDYRRAIQSHVDATAQQRAYDSGVTCSSYVNSTNPTWAAEAAAFVAWRDTVWAYAYAELEKVEGATRPQPSVAEIVAELPAMVWPA